MLVKRRTADLMDRHDKDFKTDFNENKKLVEKYADVKSKKIRNTIAGYVTRLVRSRN